MPLYGYYSGYEPSSSSKALHQIFGRGNVADIIYWRNKKTSAAILIVLTLMWLLFEVAEYPFVTFLCQVLIVSMFIILIWSNLVTERAKRRPLSIEDIRLSESTCRSLFSGLNQFIAKLYDISSGKDFRLFILMMVSLWIFSILGSYLSSLTLLYLVFVCLETIPVMYERHQGDVDRVASKSGEKMKRLFNDVNTKVLRKIPRGPVKEKKRT